MARKNFSQRYIGEILIALNGLRERNGSTLTSITEYINQNRTKSPKLPESNVLKERIKKTLQSALNMNLLRCVNGKYQFNGHMTSSKRGIRQQRGRSKGKKSKSQSRSRSRSRSRNRRNNNRRQKRQKRQGSKNRRSASGQRRRSPMPKNNIQNQQPEQNDCVEEARDDHLDCACD